MCPVFSGTWGENKIVESSKDLKVQGLFPIPSGSMGTSRPTDDLNLNCSGKEKQLLSQDVRDSKTPRSFGLAHCLRLSQMQ